MAQDYHGSCLCNRIQFSVEGFNDKAANCHCTMCRKFHGAAFGTLVAVKGLQWLSGQDYLSEFTAENGTIRTFCKNCGSSLGFRCKGTTLEEIELAIATFDEDIPVKIDAQIYTDNKANWCELYQDVAQYKAGRTA